MAATTYTAQTIATQAKNGPLVAQLSAEQVAVLAANYVGDYQNFLRLIDSYVNQEIHAIENNLPEETPVRLVMPGLNGYAKQWAQVIDQQWQQGKIQWQGEKLKAWPGASQVAYSDASGNTMTLEWLKGQPWGWIVVGILVAVMVVYEINTIRGSQYSMTAYTPATGTGTTGTTTSTLPSGSTILASAAKNWPWIVLVGGGLVATPFVIRHVAETREAENEYKAAERGAY